VWGIDLADALLARCAENAAGGGVDIRLQQGDIEALPYREASFDRVYSFSSLWYVPNLGTALAEMARVTRPGGTIVFDMLNAAHVTPALAWLATSLKRWMGRSTGWWRPRTHGSVAHLLAGLGLRWEMQGFGVLLPTSLPVVGERANIAGRVGWLHTGLRRSPARYLGAKLVYRCRRPATAAAGDRL
jgi:SAM-dependent methyltransferase